MTVAVTRRASGDGAGGVGGAWAGRIQFLAAISPTAWFAAVMPTGPSICRTRL